ncbi:hypothetical protein [Salisediminibacterium beveridgei]|uniref:hypothetical protein n=1 Tax=Salisediminibacterium beveridgei TaxID=632773 RepID=UPI00084832B0|nr:hypothetical protein [Salisediminibacterium beveridgei]
MGAIEQTAFFGIILILLFFSVLMILNWTKSRENKKRKATDSVFIAIGVSLVILTGVNQQLFMLVILGLFLFVFLLKYQVNKVSTKHS